MMTHAATALPNELTLIKRSLVDSSAFADIYDHYFARVYNYIRYRVQEADLTDDLTAQVFERVLLNLSRYNPEKAPFSAWLFAIARNIVNDHLRKQRRWHWLPLDKVWNWRSNDPPPSQQVTEQETQQRLLQLVAQLGQREQDLLALKFAGGLTNRRIAELTGLSSSNVGVILHRAIRQLRLQLEAEE